MRKKIDRPLGWDTWFLSSGVKLKLCSHTDPPRTKLVAKAELWPSKELMLLNCGVGEDS